MGPLPACRSICSLYGLSNMVDGSANNLPAKAMYSLSGALTSLLSGRQGTCGLQECFEGEAEVLQDSHKDTGLRFEEEGTCVHASKPSSDAVDAVEYDSASEGDPEASSLAGSVSSAVSHPILRAHHQVCMQWRIALPVGHT